MRNSWNKLDRWLIRNWRRAHEMEEAMNRVRQNYKRVLGRIVERVQHERPELDNVRIRLPHPSGSDRYGSIGFSRQSWASEWPSVPSGLWIEPGGLEDLIMESGDAPDAAVWLRPPESARIDLRAASRQARQTKMKPSDSNPNGVVRQSPGLARRQPWVTARQCPSTPTGLRPGGRKTGRLRPLAATTTLGLVASPSPLPRVVPSVQPWALLHNRVAVEAAHHLCSRPRATPWVSVQFYSAAGQSRFRIGTSYGPLGPINPNPDAASGPASVPQHNESRFQRSEGSLADKPRALPWAGMNDAVGVSIRISGSAGLTHAR
jgi:hypothetical protein